MTESDSTSAAGSAPETPAFARLTKEDLKALREADAVHFRVAFQNGRQFGEIVCKKTVPKNGPFDDEEKRYIIRNVRFDFDVYQKDWKGAGWILTGVASAYRWNDYWQTTTGSLREGDEPELRFCIDGSANDNVRNAGLHHDTFYLRARRDGKKAVLAWVVDWSVCPQNTARMVRRTLRPEDDFAPAVT
jgi:hypothetical protein